MMLEIYFCQKGGIRLLSGSKQFRPFITLINHAKPVNKLFLRHSICQDRLNLKLLIGQGFSVLQFVFLYIRSRLAVPSWQNYETHRKLQFTESECLVESTDMETDIAYSMYLVSNEEEFQTLSKARSIHIKCFKNSCRERTRKFQKNSLRCQQF